MFGREWFFVGYSQGLSEPGDYLACDIAGWPLLVVVDDDGELRAHHNVCRHRVGPLVNDGCGRVRSLVCRYHGWAYGLDGRLRSARDFGATDGFDPAEVSLTSALEPRGGRVCAGSPQPPARGGVRRFQHPVRQAVGDV